MGDNIIKKLLVVISLFLFGGCSIYSSNIDKRLSTLENANKSIQKQFKVLMPGQEAPQGIKVLEGSFKPQDLADAMAGGERAIYIRAFTGLTGGTTGKLDKIANVDLDDAAYLSHLLFSWSMRSALILKSRQQQTLTLISRFLGDKQWLLE